LPENVKPLQHGTREGVKIVTLAAVTSGAFGCFAVGLEAGLDEFRGR
jgi:hypothetical protein